MKKHTPYLVMFAIAVVYCIGNLAVWQRQPYTFNLLLNACDAVHFRTVMEMYEDMHHGTFKIFPLHYFNAPLTPLLTAGLLHFGKEHVTLYILLVNFIYFFVALFFTYKIGERMSGASGGILAASLLAMYPGVYGLSRVYGRCDFAVMAAIPFNIFCLLKSDGFKNTGWSLLYGVSIGLGLLAKDSFLAFFFAPLVFTAGAAFLTGEKKGNAAVLLAAVMIGVVISSPHYINADILKKAAFELVNEQQGSWYAFDNLRVYTIGLSEEILSPPFFIVFIVGLLGFIKKYRNGKVKAIVLLWLVAPWLIFLLMPHRKVAAYGIPYAPAIAIISAVGVREVFKARHVRYVMPVLIAVGVLQYVEFSYGWGSGLHNLSVDLKNDREISYYNLRNEMFFYTDERWKLYKKTMTGLERALKQNTDNSTVMVTMEDVVERFIHPSVLKIIGWLNGFPLRVVDDSIFAENIFDEPMKNGKPCIVFYAGKNGFGSQEYYEEQLIRGIMLAKDHPALHNDIMEKVDGVHSEDFGKRLAVFAASFELQEELFKVEGNIRGILYVRQSAAALKRKAIEEGQSELHHVHDVTFR